MGFKATDLVPINSNGPTVTVPTNKDAVVKAFQVSRTDTTASLKAVLPADASIVDIDINGPASNAGTTATISIGSTSANSNEYVNGQDVKTAGGKIRPTSTYSTSLPNVEPLPLGPDLQIFAKYAETGTASSSGGPWTILIWYVR
jgi:hypothetical protein